jgi:hypothetical protein
MSPLFSDGSRVFRRGRFFASLLALVGLLGVLVTPIPSLAVGGTSGSLHGQLVASAGGAAVAGAAVTATSPSGTYKATTDGSGSFTFLQIPVDTYVVSFEKTGFEPNTLTGVTVVGDSTVDIGKVSISKSLSTIGRVTARSQGSAFQPSQTQDTYTVSGQRITQALGNEYSTNEAELLQSVPGVIPTYDTANGAGLSVRGSLGVELGYQFDGVPFTAPFFDENGSQGFLNNIVGGSGGSLQVVSGAGDATQGNSGGGTINTIVPRGAYPGSAVLDLELGAPFYNHTLNFNDSFATANGKISNYFAYSGSRYVPEYVPFGANSIDQSQSGNTANFGTYYAIGSVEHDDLIDNFVFKFGHNNNQSIQILERNADLRGYAGYGGLKGLDYFTDPTTSPGGFLTQLSTGSIVFGPGSPIQFPGATVSQQNQYLAKLIPTIPYQPSANALVNTADEVVANPLNFMKFEYTNNINASTYASVTYYNWGLYQGGTDYSNYPSNGVFGTDYQEIGGTRTGFLADITKQIGSDQTITLEGKYENAKPFWDEQAPGIGTYALYLGSLYDNFVAPGVADYPEVSDYFLPAHPGLPVSATNPCLGQGTGKTAIANGAGGCYIYSELLAEGKWTGTLPQIPNFGIDYHNTDEQQWGIGLRDQYSPTPHLHLDLGVRVDGEQNRFGQDQFNASTPSDVNPDKVSNAFIRPREVEPRAAVSYQLGPDDSVRGSYGRSTLFFFGQTLGTPINAASLSPLLDEIPAKDSAQYPACGSGTHGPGTGYAQNPGLDQNPVANGGLPSYFFKCPNYAVSIVSLYDQFFDAPDLGGYGPPTYNNFDFAYSHQFSKGLLKGWANHATAYVRTGFNVEQNQYLASGPPNPITGQTSAAVFTTTANGSERTFGIEEQITTPEIPKGHAGFSAFGTLDYINEYTNTPPVAGGSNLPILDAYLLQSHEYFHAGFIPPVTISTGFTYQLKNGIRITPSLLANTGYAFGVGRSSFGFINGVLYTVPETNYGVGVPYAGVGGPGNAYNASYFVDPQVPGATLKPNIVGSRGYDEPAIAGNGRSPSQAYLNLNVEFPLTKNATVGVEIFNLTNNVYGVPEVNTEYQPVATGIAGPQTGKLATSLPYSSSYVVGAGDESYHNGATLPFLNGYGAGITFNVYGRIKI